VYADKSGISRVISNLINNSIKFTQKEGGIISVFVENRETNKDNEEGKETVVVSVKDNGTGIDREIMPKLFGKFNTKSFQGMGLGLYISKNLVDAHSGKIWAENNRDMAGATFSFSLPIKNLSENSTEFHQD
jgi:signal transduction histidine kinase